MNIKFSIVVATHERSDDIARLLASLRAIGILARTDVEFVLVDNAPVTDRVRMVCEQYPEVRYMVEPQKGKARALNTGCCAAVGEFLVFTDDDVEVRDPHWLDTLAALFTANPKLGYVSGNVVAAELISEATTKWERKGGLSKGGQPKHFTQAYLAKFRLKPWPLTKICAGANCMIPRRVMEGVGWYCELFGPGSPIVGHGESLEIGYRIIAAGYELMYTPDTEVYHYHPQEADAIRRKLRLYGTGDTGIHMYLFTQYRDFRSLYWVFPGHQLYLLGNMWKSIRGQYPLPVSFILESLKGSLSGGIVFLWRRWRMPKERKSRWAQLWSQLSFR
jgi:GT2 family glycosyltransferase